MDFVLLVTDLFYISAGLAWMGGVDRYSIGP